MYPAGIPLPLGMSPRMKLHHHYEAAGVFRTYYSALTVPCIQNKPPPAQHVLALLNRAVSRSSTVGHPTSAVVARNTHPVKRAIEVPHAACKAEF